MIKKQHLITNQRRNHNHESTTKAQSQIDDEITITNQRKNHDHKVTPKQNQELARNCKQLQSRFRKIISKRQRMGTEEIIPRVTQWGSLNKTKVTRFHIFDLIELSDTMS